MNHFAKTPVSMNPILPDYHGAKGDYLIDLSR
jgi:hypothetical protein